MTRVIIAVLDSGQRILFEKKYYNGLRFSYILSKISKIEDRRVKSVPAYLQKHVEQVQLHPHLCPQVRILHQNQ
jgi:hypothetical protein